MAQSKFYTSCIYVPDFLLQLASVKAFLYTPNNPSSFLLQGSKLGNASPRRQCDQRVWQGLQRPKRYYLLQLWQEGTKVNVPTPGRTATRRHLEKLAMSMARASTEANLRRTGSGTEDSGTCSLHSIPGSISKGPRRCCTSLGSEVDAMHLTNAAELCFAIRKTDVGAQKLDAPTLEAFVMP